jgi:hypothetical protein
LASSALATSTRFAPGNWYAISTAADLPLKRAIVV